jgi:mannosyl-oligosaccharide glucosidase
MLGLMWFDASAGAAFEPDSAVRHEAQQSDRLISYGWLVHDGRSYGRQEIMDGPFNITLQMVSGPRRR